MTLALAAGASFDEAARLANYAGGLVVMKRGTATVTADELARRDPARPRAVERPIGNRAMPSSPAGTGRGGRRDRAAGRTIAFANGCFDLLHVGHVRYLQAAARRGRSADRRGQRRRVGARAEGRRAGRSWPAADRAELVAALRGVDYVVLFAEPDRRRRCSTRCKPDVHCKGTDYTVDTVPERDDRRAPTAAASRSSAIRRITRRATSWRGSRGAEAA